MCPRSGDSGSNRTLRKRLKCNPDAVHAFCRGTVPGTTQKLPFESKKDLCCFLFYDGVSPSLKKDVTFFIVTPQWKNIWDILHFLSATRTSLFSFILKDAKKNPFWGGILRSSRNTSWNSQDNDSLNKFWSRTLRTPHIVMIKVWEWLCHQLNVAGHEWTPHSMIEGLRFMLTRAWKTALTMNWNEEIFQNSEELSQNYTLNVSHSRNHFFPRFVGAYDIT